MVSCKNNMKRNILVIVILIIFMITAIHAKARKNTYSSLETDESRSITYKQNNMIGLLELPSIFGIADPNGPPGSTLPFNKKIITVYNAPSMKSTVIKLIKCPDDLELREHSYEVLSVVTYQEKEGWYLIGIKNNKLTRGWICPEDAGKFRPYKELITDSLTYLTDEWDGIIWRTPDINSNSESIKEFPTRHVRIIETKKINNKLWLHIELLNPGWCDLEDPKAIKKGWIPAFSKSCPNVWFYSRGC